MANPISPAPIPKMMKTVENPITKLREWRNMEKRFLAKLDSNISGPHKLARYTGTKGSTQGDKKDSNPALKATRRDICSITHHHNNFNGKQFDLKYQVNLHFHLISYIMCEIE